MIRAVRIGGGSHPWGQKWLEKASGRNIQTQPWTLEGLKLRGKWDDQKRQMSEWNAAKLLPGTTNAVPFTFVICWLKKSTPSLKLSNINTNPWCSPFSMFCKGLSSWILIDVSALSSLRYLKIHLKEPPGIWNKENTKSVPVLCIQGALEKC